MATDVCYLYELPFTATIVQNDEELEYYKGKLNLPSDTTGLVYVFTEDSEEFWYTTTSFPYADESIFVGPYPFSNL